VPFADFPKETGIGCKLWVFRNFPMGKNFQHIGSRLAAEENPEIRSVSSCVQVGAATFRAPIRPHPMIVSNRPKSVFDARLNQRTGELSIALPR
jgi:hypothetical protein